MEIQPDNCKYEYRHWEFIYFISQLCDIFFNVFCNFETFKETFFPLSLEILNIS